MNLRQSHKVLEQIYVYAWQRKYEILLTSFMLLIFADTFTHPLGLIFCNLVQNMLTGLVIFYRKKRTGFLILLLILFTILFGIYGHQINAFIDVKSWQGIIYLIYFFLISKEVFKEVLYSKKVDRELLAAVLCGFVLLCMIGTFLFYQIELKSPNSFSNVGENRNAMKNLNYFSFTTLLTIGYGDIIPLSLVAKRAVMLIGLTGHFYTVFVTSIIIGKYISHKKELQ